MALADQDSDALVSIAPALLRRLSEGSGARFLLAMLRSKPSFPSSLLDPAFFSPSDSEKLAVLLATLNPAPHPGAQTEPGNDTAALSLLRVLDLGPEDGGILLPALLLHHGSPRVRSKAALLAARTDHHRDWMRFLRAEGDARVRANTIEALWDSPNEGVREVFRVFAHDLEPRVAANSVAGLHRHDFPRNAAEAESLLREMTQSPDPRFVASAAWAMGATGDLRYLPMLGDLIKRSGPHVKCALQSMRNLRAMRNPQAMQTGSRP